MQNVDDPINQIIRRRIRIIRQRKKISVRSAARLCDIPESSYSCMENGFYRISLLNLNKMLSGLGVGIEEVWPRTQQKGPREEAREVGEADPSFFRFQEIHLLSRAVKSALLRGLERMEFLYSINVDGRGRLDLLESLKSGDGKPWVLFPKQVGKARVCLCLKDPVLPDHVKRLIGIYLDLWLASDISKETFR